MYYVFRMAYNGSVVITVTNHYISVFSRKKNPQSKKIVLYLLDYWDCRLIQLNA